MVATVTRLSEAASTVHYFETDGYYAKNDPEHRKASRWYGAGVAALGLHGPVKPRRFEQVLSGRIPGTSTRLGRLRDGKHEHRPGLDITFSAPKSVSLEALVHAAPKASARIIRAHDEAVTATLDFIENELLETRGWHPATRRRPRIKADGLVAATFRHLASRNLDPQLHTHSVVANMTRNPEGEWRSADFIKVERAKHLIGAHYRGELKRRLEALGYATEQTMVGNIPGFEIAGYDKETLKAFSTRRVEALAWVKERNRDARSAAVMQQAVLYTRRRKDEPSREELGAIWKARMAELEPRNRRVSRGRSASHTRLDRERWHLRRRDAANRQSPSPLHAVRRVVEHLEERRTVFTATMLRALVLAPGRWTLPEIDAAIARLTHEGHLIKATRARSDLAFVTDRAVKAERAVIRWMKKESDAPEHLAIHAVDVRRHLEAGTLNSGQQAAVSTLLLSSRHVCGVQGHAGTGKTTMLREVVELAGAERIVALAPSSSAARTLQQETGIGTKTLQWFLARYRDVGDGCTSEETLAKARAALECKLLVVDEASLVSMAQMHSLARIAEATGIARVALVGDHAQLRSVEAGQPFRVLQKAGMETAVMDEVMRQRNEGLKAAVLHMIDQKPELAIEELGPGVLEMDADELGPRAAALWLDLGMEEREATKVLAPTHARRREITDAIREGLMAEGSLHGRTLEIERFRNLHLTRAQKGDLANWREGDVAVFHADVYGVQAKSGDIFGVIGSEGEKVLLKHPDGKTRRVDPSKYLRYRVELYETEGIEVQAGERIRWTRNDKGRSLFNGEEAQILSIGKKTLKLRTADGRTLTLGHDDPQLHFIDHAWTSTVHAAQGITCDQVIAVLDADHGAIAGQAAFYVELTRARDNAVLLTDDRDGLVEALETATGDELSALEAIGHQFQELPPEITMAAKESIPPEALSDAQVWKDEVRATCERHLDLRLAEREVLLDRARSLSMEESSALAAVAGHDTWRDHTLATIETWRGETGEEPGDGAGKADLLERLVAFDDRLAEFNRDRQRHALAARAVGEDFALHPGIEGLVARGRALVETAPRPEEVPWDLPSFLDLVTTTHRDHDEVVAQAEVLARLERAERDLDAVNDARRTMRDLAQGEPLHALPGYADWRERADAAIDALQTAVVQDGEREQRDLDYMLRLDEAIRHDDDVAGLITDWIAFEDEARSRGMEALDLAAAEPLLSRTRHLVDNPPEGETALQALTGILARHQARTEERERAAATITRSLDGYRVCHQPLEDAAKQLSRISEWCDTTREAIDAWRAMTVVDERDPALSTLATDLKNIVAFEERAIDVDARLQDARGDDGTANPFLEVAGDVLATDLRRLQGDLPRHAVLLPSLRQALDELDSHEALLIKQAHAAARLTRALDDYRACHAPTQDSARQLSDIGHWCHETQQAIDAWRSMMETDKGDPKLSETATVLEDLIAFEERARDLLLKWSIAGTTRPFLGSDGDALVTELRTLRTVLPRHAILLRDLNPAFERLAEYEQSVVQTRELLERVSDVDEARRSLLEREGLKSRPLSRRFNKAWKRWKDAAEAVVADIDTADGALIAHLDEHGMARRVRAEYAASDRLDCLPGWLLLRLHDNVVNAGSTVHPAMTEDYAGIMREMYRLAQSLKERDPRRSVLHGEIDRHDRIQETWRNVVKLLGDLRAHNAKAALLDDAAKAEELPMPQSMAWAQWYSHSRRFEDEARTVLDGGGDYRLILHDGQGTRRAFEEAIARFERTRAAHGEPDDFVRLEQARKEEGERRRARTRRCGGGLSM